MPAPLAIGPSALVIAEYEIIDVSDGPGGFTVVADCRCCGDQIILVEARADLSGTRIVGKVAGRGVRAHHSNGTIISN